MGLKICIYIKFTYINSRLSWTREVMDKSSMFTVIKILNMLLLFLYGHVPLLNTGLFSLFSRDLVNIKVHLFNITEIKVGNN